ncbi:MAG: Ig-like domain-containing protein [Chloroflexota bacterium]
MPFRTRQQFAAFALVALVAQLVVPSAALAVQSWSVSSDTSSLGFYVPTDVTITATNTSTTTSAAEAIGCVTIVLPAKFTVSSAVVQSVSSGSTWTVGVATGGSNTVSAVAASDGDRLFGSPLTDQLVLRIRVMATQIGTFNWTARQFNTIDCASGLGSPVGLPVTVTVGSNNSPVAVADSASVSHDRVLTVGVPGVLSNDSDPDGHALSAVLDSGPGGGSLFLNADGSYQYTPSAGFVGNDSFAYHAFDGAASSSTVAVTISVTNTPPAAVADATAVQKNVAAVVSAPGVLVNDTDADADSLTAAVLTGPSNGGLSLAPDGSFTYAPAAGFAGTDSFTYTASDGIATSIGTVTLTVSNTAPSAADDGYATGRNVQLVVLAVSGVLANDTDGNGDSLSATVSSGPSSGSLTLALDGSLSYVPTAGFTGLDAFTYTASDGALSSSVATVTIAVSNRAPSASDLAYQVVHDRTLSKSVGAGILAAASDADGDALSAALVSGPLHGTLALASDGSFVYVPDAYYVGPDGFSASVSDGLEGVTVSVALNVTNAAPTATSGAASVAADTTLRVPTPGLLGGVSDADGDGVTVVVTAPPIHGSLTVMADGSWTYAPDPGYSGPDSFTFVGFDGLATSAAETMTISVVPPAPTPTPNPTSLQPAESTAPTSPEPSVAPSPTPGSATAPPSPDPNPGATPGGGGGSGPANLPPDGPPGDTFSIPGAGPGSIDFEDLDLGMALLGRLGAFAWAVPGLALSVSGLVVFLTILAQVLGGGLWIPLVRRKIGSFGIADRPATRT